MIITRNEIAKMDRAYRAMLINSLPGYRSLLMVGTISNDGITNLGLFSSVFHVGANPPLLGMVMRPNTSDHDTLNNIQSTGQYTLNNVLPDWLPQAHQTSAHYPSGVSEFDACGFKKFYSHGFNAPFVQESTIKIGMELRESIDVEINNTTILIGEIVQILVDETLIESDGYIDHLKAATVAVAGLDSYFTTKPLQRLPYAKPLNVFCQFENI